MKPRLVRIHGLWHCGIQRPYGFVVIPRDYIGVGFSKEAAYDDWKRGNNRG